MKPIRFLLVVLVLLALAVGCSSSPYERVSSATLGAGAAIPAPAQDAVFTVSGNFTAKNAGATLALDLPTLEKFGLVKYKVNDPWLNANNEYTGVLVSDFLQTIGASPDAQTLHLVAIDDYTVELKISDLKKWPILLATQTNGKYMSIADKGPTRIIFPYDISPDLDKAAYKDFWVWSIKSMEVR